MAAAQKSIISGNGVVAVAGGGAFVRRWLEFIPNLGFEVRNVDLYSPTLMRDLQDCKALLASFSQDVPRDMKFGRDILKAVATSGLAVYPNDASGWHFEDKIAQALIFDSLGMVVPRTRVFFDWAEAAGFIDGCKFPLVFKLRTGAGGLNVRMVHTQKEARQLAARMFRSGIRAHNVTAGIKRMGVAALTKPFEISGLLPRVRRAGRRFIDSRFRFPRESGYVLFQDYVGGCDYSIRVAVIGRRAFAYRRNNQRNDFRSGVSSERVVLAREDVPLAMVKAAFAVSERLGCQSMGYDFLPAADGGLPVLLEMCHTFPAAPIAGATGSYTPDLDWIPGGCHPEDLIASDLLQPWLG